MNPEDFKIYKPERYLMKILLFFVVFCSFLILNTWDCYSQSITWQRTYDGPFSYKETGYSLCPADSNNFYVVGDTYHPSDPFIRYIYILKLNPYGDTIWTRYFGSTGRKSGYTSVSDGRGGCVIAGDSDSAYTLCINSSGNILWYKTYGISTVQCFDIKKTSDSGYIATGRKLSSDWYGYIMKIDSAGNLEWQKLYTSTEYKSYNSVVILNGEYYLVGTVSDQVIDTQQVLLTRIDENGDILWEKRYTVNDRDAGGQRIFSDNGNLVISGTSAEGPGSTYFMRLDTAGNKLFTKRFITTKPEALWDMKQLSENKYVLVMTRDSSYDIWSSKIMITDTLGKILHERIVTTPFSRGFIWLESVLQAANGDLLFAGFSELDDNDSADIFVARTDSLLNVPPISIVQISNNIPTRSQLYPAYPNPFNPETIIRFNISKAGNTKLVLYDLTGRAIDILSNTFVNIGEYKYILNAKKYNLSSGVYFVVLVIDNSVLQAEKIVLLK